MKIKIIILISASIALFHTGSAQTVKRGRNEGTLYIPASNVMGNGNITAYVDLGGFLSPEKLEANARIGASIGIAEILQFNIQTSFINFNRFGPTEGHLQATIPGNDRLRFCGMKELIDNQKYWVEKSSEGNIHYNKMSRNSGKQVLEIYQKYRQ